MSSSPTAPPKSAPPPPATPSASGPRAAPPAPPAPRQPPPAPRPRPQGRTAGPRQPRAPALDSERWIGQRVFLGIGVVALLVAAGYLLKLSFDRNWISPAMRCIGGSLAGIAVGALGWRLESRYRTYGAALVGAGAGIIYLSIWAACRLYGVLPSATGIVGLALVSVALAMIAYAINVEALGATAALGAFFAPHPPGSATGQRRPAAALSRLHGRRAGPGRGAAAVADHHPGRGRQLLRRRHRWARPTTPTPGAVLLYGLAGGTAGLHSGCASAGGRPGCSTFSGGGPCSPRPAERIPQHWAVLAAGLVLSAPVWWHGLRRPQVFPIHLGPRGAGPGWSAGEALYFFVTPVLLGWAVHGLDARYFDARPWLASRAGRACPICSRATLGPDRPSRLVGAAALGIAAVQRWEGVPAGVGAAGARGGLGGARSPARPHRRALVRPAHAHGGRAAGVRRGGGHSTGRRPGVHRLVGAGAVGYYRRDRSRSPHGSGGSRRVGRTRD